MIAASKDLLKLSGLTNSDDQILVDRGSKFSRNPNIPSVHRLDLNGRGGQLRTVPFGNFWNRGFSLLQLLAGWRSNVGTRVDQLNALSSPCPFVNARIA